MGGYFLVYTTRKEVDHKSWDLYREDVQLCFSGGVIERVGSATNKATRLFFRSRLLNVLCIHVPFCCDYKDLVRTLL